MIVLTVLSLPIWAGLFILLQDIVGRKSGAHMRGKRLTEPHIRKQLLGVTNTLLIVGCFSLAKNWFVDLDALLPIRLSGWGIVLLGLALSMWAQRCLGPNWVGGVGTVKGHRLVTGGPYRFVRHPLYSGVLLSAVGIGLVSLDPFYGLAALAFAAALIVRYPFEERVLKGKFKGRQLEQYKTYLQNTPAIFPRLWRKEP